MHSVLVTGGSGSFGQAFVKHLLTHTNPPHRIAVLSRGERAQAEMAQAFKPLDDAPGGDPRLRFFIGDVRDRDRLRRAMEGIEVVVHAAALKRIEVGAYNPTEMVKTNILGTMNVIEAATDAGIKKVVGLSSDKAWQPISPYGQSKALAEMLLLSANNTRGAKGPIFSVTRYGNVWKSNGSVVPKWLQMIASGASRVPVTDVNCTRFFMTMDEAVRLVLTTINEMSGGELKIPALPAYRLGDIVEAMGVEADVVGLPKYEKLHESMCESLSSDKARRMSIDELRAAL